MWGSGPSGTLQYNLRLFYFIEDDFTLITLFRQDTGEFVGCWIGVHPWTMAHATRASAPHIITVYPHSNFLNTFNNACTGIGVNTFVQRGQRFDPTDQGRTSDNEVPITRGAVMAHSSTRLAFHLVSERLRYCNDFYAVPLDTLTVDSSTYLCVAVGASRATLIDVTDVPDPE